jgi:hypothetical protein
MSQTIFNLYAASVFAEQPLAVWPIDDDFGFVSLIGASAIWSVSGGSQVYNASATYIPVDSPGETVGIASQIDYTQSIATFSASGTMNVKSQYFNLLSLDPYKPSVCVSSYIYPYEDSISECKIGFQYVNPDTLATVKNYSTFTSFNEDEWTKIEYTLDLNTSLWTYSSSNINVYPYMEFTFKDGTSKVLSVYNFSVGQWSEQYNNESIGVVPSNLTSNSLSASLIFNLGPSVSEDPSTIKIVETDPYNIANVDTGYYIIENNTMLCTNSLLPMVYGSRNLTEINSSPNGLPGIIFPGKGFLHENGRYKNLTAEFWLRVNCKTSKKIKIFGPLTSNDGIYVHDNYISLKVGPYEQSYFIGKWYVPMLVSFVYSSTFVRLMINGAIVITININQNDLELPTSESYDTDWLGFYAYDGVPQMQIDCFGIFPYVGDPNIVKKRFVNGQAVGKSQDIVSNFGGDLTSIDFSFAKYTNNLTYPDMTKWNAGFYSNLNAQTLYVELPTLDPPDISYYGEDLGIFTLDRLNRTWGGIRGYTENNDLEAYQWGTWDDLLFNQWTQVREADPLYDSFQIQSVDERWQEAAASTSTQRPFIKFRPTSVYKDVYGYIAFQNINPILDTTKSIFGLFSLSQTDLDSYIDDEGITSSNYQNFKFTLMHFSSRATSDVFNIFIDLKYESGEIKPNKIKYQFNSTTIYEESFLSLSSQRYFIVGIDLDQITTSNPSLIKKYFSNRQNIALNVGGNITDMFPGKIHRVTFNNKFFTTKDLQNNISTGGIFKSSTASTSFIASNNSIFDYIGNYTLLFKRTNSTMIMDVGSTGYWEDSLPLSYFGSEVTTSSGAKFLDLDILQFNIDAGPALYANEDYSNIYDTKNISAYVTLQTFGDVGTINYSDYTVTKAIGSSRTVDFEDDTVNPDITKFEVIDNTVIFAPKTLVDFNEAYITFHLEFKTDGVSTSPIRLHRMSMASLAFDQPKLFPINTLTGNKVYPFARNGMSYSSKTRNPFAMSKDSVPYLYLTGDSGITTLPYAPLDSLDASFNRGVFVPINAGLDESYTLYGFHAWMNFNKSETITSRVKIMTLNLENSKIVIYLEPDGSDKRAYIKAYSAAISREEEYNNINLYQNGILMDKPYVNPMIWSLLTFSFPTPLTSNGYISKLEVHPGVVFNNICVYKKPIENVVDDIYESHMGLSHIVASDSSTLTIDMKDLLVYSDIGWTTFSGKVV